MSPSPTDPFVTASKNTQSAIDKFNKDYEKTPFGTAGTAASKALDEFTKANAAFKNGDTKGGSAALLRGFGALSAALAVGGGPVGAAVGALLGAFLGVIALILEMFKPASDSLEAKLEKFIVEQDLKDAYEKLVAKKAVWALKESDIERMADKPKAGGYTWMELDGLLGWEEHYGHIIEAFAKLKDNADFHTKAWLALFDITVTYALRFWMYFEIMASMLIAPDEKGKPSGKNLSITERQNVATQLRDSVLSVHFHSVSEVDFHALNLPNNWAPYYAASDSMYAYWNDREEWFHPGESKYAFAMNYIYHRIGVAEGSDMSDIGLGYSICFAVADSGTIFSVGNHPYTLYVGRVGSDWYKVDPATFGGDDVEQVTIGKLPEITINNVVADNLVVVCLHGQGKKVSYNVFNDAEDATAVNTPHGWAPGAERWGTWKTYNIPDGMTILSQAVQVDETYWRLYAFALDASGNGQLYQVFMGDSSTAQMIGFPETLYSPDALTQATWHVAPKPDRSELSPVTVSCVGEALYVQVGNEILVRENGNWFKWPMREYLNDSGLWVYQARVFADGALVLSTNRGLIMRYTDPSNNKITDYTVKNINTIWFWKGVSHHAHAARELLAMTTLAVTQPV